MLSIFFFFPFCPRCFVPLAKQKHTRQKKLLLWRSDSQKWEITCYFLRFVKTHIFYDANTNYKLRISNGKFYSFLFMFFCVR